LRTALILGTAVAAALTLAPSAFAQDAQKPVFVHDDGTPFTADEKIEFLQQELDSLKRQRDVDQEVATSAAAKAATATLDTKGLVFSSPDGKYQFAINAQVNVDADGFGHDGGTLQDQIQDRLIRPTFSGRAGNASFRITPELGGSSAASASIVDAYVEYKVSDPLQFRFGKFKSPIGLERLQADPDVLWTERGHSTNLVPNRDVGYLAFGTLASGAVEYQVGELDGAADGVNFNNDVDNRKDLVYRVFTTPFAQSDIVWLQGFGIGYAGTDGNHLGNTTNTQLPAYKTPGQQTFFKYAANVFSSGKETRSNPEAYFYLSNFSLLADYVEEKQAVRLGAATANLKNRALDVSGSWIITGEPASFKGGVKPYHDFNLNGSGWGAWELTARYGYTDVDNAAFTGGFASLSSSASKATSTGFGVAWYLSQNLKLLADFDKTRFVGGSAKGNRPDETFTSGRVQFRY
jgi:phosphate-selective porin OprO/OprP